MHSKKAGFVGTSMSSIQCVEDGPLEKFRHRSACRKIWLGGWVSRDSLYQSQRQRRRYLGETAFDGFCQACSVAQKRRS